GDRVCPAGLGALKELPSDLKLQSNALDSDRRIRLADWLTDRRNPLTARVMVNRIWHYHFGAGIVNTPNDFGFNGDKPSHQELLDWLAAEFARSGWSMKALHRIMMLSSTYRQSWTYDVKAAALDTDNRLLWRFSPRRLEGEEVRDTMLTLSGKLN